MNHHLCIATVEAVRLAQDDAAGPDMMTILIIGLLSALAIAAGGMVSWSAWRDRARDAPTEQAFRILCRRVGLDSRAIAALRRLSQRSSIPPVALLLSEHARQRAIATFGAEPGLEHLGSDSLSGR